MYIRKDWEIDPLPIYSNNNTGGKDASSTPSWWTTKSKEAWSNSFGKNANAATRANSAAAALGALDSMATTTFSLATPSQKNYYNQLKDNITALNNTRINTTNLDAIDSMQRQWRPLKTNYSWKDFYANGGYLEPHRFDAGGRAAMGIFGNTATGAATGAQIGGPWGALVGGVLGLGSGLFGFFKGHSKAKKMANRINNWSDEANDGMQYKFGSAVDNAKQQNALGLDLSTPYAYGGLMDLANSDMGAIDYGFMTDYLNMKNSQAQAKNNTIGYLGNIPSEPMTFADGGGIHIAKSKEGTYKAAADRRGISMSELADRIKANPENYSPALRKKANFYNNFARHKKSEGGNLIIGANGDTLFAFDRGIPPIVEPSDNTRVKKPIIVSNRPTPANQYTNTDLARNGFFPYLYQNKDSSRYSVKDYKRRHPNEELDLTSPIYSYLGGNMTGIYNREEAQRIARRADDIRRARAKKNRLRPHKHLDGGFFDNDDTLFALGGDMQTNSADFSTGLTHVDAGSTHEQNPYDGVQMGVAPDGQPNLVEEGETIFKDQDYVFSNRIHPKKEVLKKFHMYSKGGKLTYADVSKRLEKEAKERPNDPISKVSLKDMLTMLMDAQEQQKAEEEAKEAKKVFEALSPEEQKAVLEQIAQQQQAQANAEQQANSQEGQEVPVDENGNPIEQTEEMPNQEDIAQNDEGSMSAYGGKINKFDKGGSFKDKLISALGFSTLSDFNKWAEENKVNFDDIDWDAIEKNPLSMNFDIIAKRNPALADALKNNYDFGAYTPSTNGYDLTAFAKALNSYTKSKTKGNTAGNYAIDKDFGLGNYKTIEDLENSEAYKNYTNALVNVANAAQGQKFKLNNGVLENVDGQNFSDANLQLLNTLYNTTQGTSTFDKGKPVPMFVDNGDGTYSIAKNAKDLLIGTDGKSGLRYDHKGGIFHLTPTATTRGAKVVNRVINDDGTVEDIIGDVPTAWGKAVNTYSWNDPESSYTYNYYKRPETDANGNPKNKPILEAVHKPEWLRYAGPLGPAIGLGMQAAGIGKPDYSKLDAAIDISNEANAQADYMPIGNYLRYNPMDIWAQENRNDANARATDRAIVNNNTTAGSKMAGLLANGYNSQVADAGLYRQALEYNDAQRQKVADFNRGTDMFNAEAFDKTSQFNADAKNKNKQFKANLAADAARTRINGDANWYGSIYGNLGNLFTGISDMGKENAQHNMIADMAANSLFGTMNPDTPIAKGQHLLRYVDANGNTVDKNGNIIKKKAKGGKLKRRRGLTF